MTACPLSETLRTELVSQRLRPLYSSLVLVACLLSATGAGAAQGPHTWNQRMDESVSVYYNLTLSFDFRK